MTRDEFEDWLEERESNALDEVQQSDAPAQRWLTRLFAALKRTADEEDEAREEEDEDLFEEEVENDPEDAFDPENESEGT